MLDLNRIEIVAAVVDSQLTTKATVVIGGASFANGITGFEYIPLFITIIGGVTAFIAGVFLCIRHWSQHKLNVVNAEKGKLEIEQLKKALLDV